jgi:hypothetical protein
MHEMDFAVLNPYVALHWSAIRLASRAAGPHAVDEKSKNAAANARIIVAVFF